MNERLFDAVRRVVESGWNAPGALSELYDAFYSGEKSKGERQAGLRELMANVERDHRLDTTFEDQTRPSCQTCLTYWPCSAEMLRLFLVAYPVET